MTKQDFELIAGTFRSTRDVVNCKITWKQLVTVMGARLALSNPRFDFGKFEKACGVENDVEDTLFVYAE